MAKIGRKIIRRARWLVCQPRPEFKVPIAQSTKPASGISDCFERAPCL